MGVSCGAFIIAFHLSSYLVNSFRFPFLASLSRPFVKYTINNSIIPLAFLFTFCYKIFTFQYNNEFTSIWVILLDLAGFLLGIALFYGLSLSYFFTVSKDVFMLFGIDILQKTERRRARRVQLTGKEWIRLSQRMKAPQTRYVSTYFSQPFKIQRARDTAHYEPEMVRTVFRQNHLAAAVFEITVVVIIFLLGFFRDYPLLVFPAGASIFMSFTMLLMLASAFHTWMRGWSLTLFVLLLAAINFISQYEFFGKRNQAFGLDYSQKVTTLPDSMLFDRERRIQMRSDTKKGIERLENWKKNAIAGRSGKPTLIFLNVSGGGLKAALWTVHALQQADKATGGKLLKNTHLITGSSGGMIGAAYLRELYLGMRLGYVTDLYDPEYPARISRDMLNPIVFSLAVSDVFFRVQPVRFGALSYTRDRGYEFEKALHENTGQVMNKRLSDYARAESEGIIPTMIFSPTVINDGRRMLISSQPLSYLTFTPVKTGTVLRSLPEDIEFSRFFREQGADSLRFSTAVRMSATFPYILPAVSLPSKPVMELMDAGFRDNFGIKTSVRYLFHFRQWIAEHTDKVIFLQIRENHKSYDLKTHGKSSLAEKLISPLGNVYENMFRIQDYQNEQLLMYTDKWFPGRLDYVELDINPPSRPSDQLLSMSFHLTTLEKELILDAIEAPENKASIAKLKQLLEE